jgi:transcriptional accessory protein Tex/SPT6
MSKNPDKPSPLETIAVEVKANSLLIRDLMQAKLYEAVFGAKYTFLLSPQGMTGEKIAVVMKHNDLLRGKVIIAKCGGKRKRASHRPSTCRLCSKGIS